MNNLSRCNCHVSLFNLVSLVGVTLMLLSGCGFQLRDRSPTSAQVPRIHVSSVNAYGDFEQKLENILELAGVTVVQDNGAAPWTLQILQERNTRRAATTTRLITVAEYELRLVLEFRVVGEKGEMVIPPTELVAERIYVLHQTSLVGSSEEEELLKDEMQDDLAAQILRRVDAVAANLGAP